MENRFEDFYVGQKASDTRRYSGAEVKEFARISGDHNPIHVDEQFAANTIFKKPIAHGMFVASQISGLLANQLPGPGSIYINQELSFLAPVFWDNEVTCTVEITEIKKEKRVILLSTVCVNNEGTKVISGNAVIKYL